MKKILTLVLGLVLVASCSSDDSGGSIDASKLTNKKWYAVSTTVFGITFPIENDYPDCNRDYIMFNTGGVFVDAYHDQDCEEFIDNGSWVMEGKIITTNQDGEITSATVKKLTSSQLEVTTEEDFDEDGEMETITLLLSSN